SAASDQRNPIAPSHRSHWSNSKRFFESDLLAARKGYFSRCPQNTQDVNATREISTPFVVISIFFTLVLCAFIIYSLYSFKAAGNLRLDLKDRLALLETILGSFLGLIVDELFGTRISQQNTARK
ncbi:MAG: hypothetical protein ACR2KT_11735, partial [Methylocella sp.]